MTTFFPTESALIHASKLLCQVSSVMSHWSSLRILAEVFYLFKLHYYPIMFRSKGSEEGCHSQGGTAAHKIEHFMISEEVDEASQQNTFFGGCFLLLSFSTKLVLYYLVPLGGQWGRWILLNSMKCSRPTKKGVCNIAKGDSFRGQWHISTWIS